MFADDTNITTSDKSIKSTQNQLNKDLERVHRRLLANELSLHTDKTARMIIGSRQRLRGIDIY